MTDLTTRYDRRADVLYVFTDQNGPAHALDDGSGIVWRYLDSNNAPVGATVIDFREVWANRLYELIDQVATSLHVSRQKAEAALKTSAD